MRRRVAVIAAGGAASALAAKRATAAIPIVFAIGGDSVQLGLVASFAPGLQIQIFRASTGREIDAAFADLMRERPDAVLVGPDALFNSRRVRLATLTARHAIPATFANRDIVEAGGLMSYKTNVTDAYRQMGVYAGRILKGAKPADLPAQQATRLELVINAQTARLLGLELWQSILARADEVFE